MDTYTSLESFFSGRFPEYLDKLHQMVEINSFTANAQGVNQLGQMTAEWFSNLGFTSEFIQSTNPLHGQHILLTHAGSSEDAIIMISHLDTVFPSGECAENDFCWRIDANRVYGPGTVDIKGGTVMIYMVLDALRQYFSEQFNAVTWIVALDATEEVLSNDFGKLLVERLDPAATLACLVFEGGTPSNAKYPLVTARKGKANFVVKVEGRAAHAGNRHPQGANAIIQMAYTVQRIADLTNYDQNLTFNVGTVKGGSVVNRVPHSAVAEIEMRAFDPQVFEQGISDMLALSEKSDIASQDGFVCKVNISLHDPTMPWPRNPKTDQLFNNWRETGLKLGLQVIPEERGGLSDGNLLWEHFPTLDGLGPEGNNAHCSERAADGSKDQEYALLSSFITKAVLNTLAIQELV